MAILISTCRHRWAHAALTAAVLLSASVACGDSKRRRDAQRLAKSFACADGDAAACAERLKEEQERCAGGQAHECVLLGIAHQGGRNAPLDLAKAADLFEKACGLKEGSGCWYLGSALAQGKGRTKDAAAALVAYRTGCDLGFVNACYDVGVSFQYGRGAAKDEAAAKDAFTKACTLSRKPDGLGCDASRRMEGR